MTSSEDLRFDSKWAEEDRGFSTPCWIWTAYVSDLGYGEFGVQRPNGSWGRGSAHRWSYERKRGPIPKHLEIDHLCRVRSCVNPDHLEAVTHAENCRRKTAGRKECSKGHALPDGESRCRTCYNAYQRAYQKSVREKREANQ